MGSLTSREDDAYRVMKGTLQAAVSVHCTVTATPSLLLDFATSLTGYWQF